MQAAELQPDCDRYALRGLGGHRVQADTVLSPFASNLASEEHDIISLSAIKPAQGASGPGLLAEKNPNQTDDSMSGLSLEGLSSASPHEAAALFLAPQPAANHTSAMSSRIKPSLLTEKVPQESMEVGVAKGTAAKSPVINSGVDTNRSSADILGGTMTGSNQLRNLPKRAEFQMGQSARGAGGPSSATPALFNRLGSMPARRPNYWGASASRLSTTTEEPVTTSSALLIASHTEHACLDYDSHSDYDDSPEKPKPDNSD
ncbi:TPA: hypothetical protein ACH3X3_014072 [Trebouxia sp. C0006]